MREFSLQIPTKYVFGPESIHKIGKELRHNYKRVLIVCSAGSTVKYGILDKVKDSLENESISVYVYDKVMPNPLVSMIDEGGKLAKDLKIDLILGVGGGSAMDAAKGIAIVAKHGGSVWDYTVVNKIVNSSLDVATIPTLSATGSENNAYGVVTLDATKEKAAFVCKGAFPKLSIIDPELTLSVPEDYFKDGAVDIICHAIEAYISTKDTAPFNDLYSLSIIKTIVDITEKILADPQNVGLRGIFAWASTMALNGLNDAGREGPYTAHSLEHPASGLFNISHGRGLAVILPKYLKYFKEEKSEKLAHFGKFVFDASIQTADETLDAFDTWLNKIDRKISFKDLGIPKESISDFTNQVFVLNANKHGNIAGPREMNRDDVNAVYELCF